MKLGSSDGDFLRRRHQLLSLCPFFSISSWWSPLSGTNQRTTIVAEWVGRGVIGDMRTQQSRFSFERRETRGRPGERMTHSATIVVLRLVLERGDHQPNSQKNVGELERTCRDATRENRHRKRPFPPNLSRSMSPDAYNIGRADPSSFTIKAPQDPLPTSHRATIFSRRLVVGDTTLQLPAILLVSGLVVSSLRSNGQTNKSC